MSTWWKRTAKLTSGYTYFFVYIWVLRCLLIWSQFIHVKQENDINLLFDAIYYAGSRRFGVAIRWTLTFSNCFIRLRDGVTSICKPIYCLCKVSYLLGNQNFFNTFWNLYFIKVLFRIDLFCVIRNSKICNVYLHFYNPSTSILRCMSNLKWILYTMLNCWTSCLIVCVI